MDAAPYNLLTAFRQYNLTTSCGLHYGLHLVPSSAHSQDYDFCGMIRKDRMLRLEASFVCSCLF